MSNNWQEQPRHRTYSLYIYAPLLLYLVTQLLRRLPNTFKAFYLENTCTKGLYPTLNKLSWMHTDIRHWFVYHQTNEKIMSWTCVNKESPNICVDPPIDSRSCHKQLYRIKYYTRLQKLMLM